MSSRKSHSSGEGLPSKYGERTPLRCLENDMPYLSTPSSKMKASADVVKTTKDEVHFCDTESHLPFSPSATLIQTSASANEMTTAETTCGLGDVTFKTFLCPGGEVEISGSLVCPDQSIVLPYDQATCNTETEDSVQSDSMTVELCSKHIDHPYHNPERMDVSLIDNGAVCLCETFNSTLASENMDDKLAAQDSGVLQICGTENVASKSDFCDSSNAEVANVIRQHGVTVPLSPGQLDESLQDSNVNSTNFSDSSHLCQTDYADGDHLRGNSENVASVIPGLEECANELRDVTFKSFNCTGGDIEIADGTRHENEIVPLPVNYSVTSSVSYSDSIDQSISAGDCDMQNRNEHFDHPYCNIRNSTRESLTCITNAMDEVEQINLVLPNESDKQDRIAVGSFIKPECAAEESNGPSFSENTPPPDDQAVNYRPQDDNSVPASVTQNQIKGDNDPPNCHVKNGVSDLHPPAFITSAHQSLDNESSSCQVEDTLKHSIHPEDSALPSMLHKAESSDCSKSVASAASPPPTDVQHPMEHDCQERSSSERPDSSEAKDSALGPSGNGPVNCNSMENLNAENLPDVLKALRECPSVASALQFGIPSPVVRRASLSVLKAHTGLGLNKFLVDDSVLDAEKSLADSVVTDPSGLWAEQLESPLPHPLFNSTAVGHKPESSIVTESEKDMKPHAVPQVEKPVLEFPLIPDGPLQQQLRQMAEFLILASGKMAPSGVPASAQPPAAVTDTKARASPPESHSVCVGTTAVNLVDHSLNTSGQFEQKRDFAVVDSCTLTDPLLWNVPPGSLECLPRQELEQRLRSSMIMVEALVQQLAAARAQGCSLAGPAPSDLREKLVQTDHTELSQTTGYRDLYLEALRRISELELDGSSLQNLIQRMQDTRVTMTTLSSDTDAALSNMKHMGDIVKEDHQSLVLHFGQMKSLFEKTKEMQIRMMQKVKDALHQRNDMRTQMDEAFTAKEAAFRAMEQLRTHCATEISELEKSVGSQQELLAALNQTYPEQVALNQTCNETLKSVSEILSQTTEEHSSLMRELCRVRGLLLKTAPMLLKLNETAAAALSERDEHISARAQAVEERERIEEELNETNLNLQTANEQIGDLNLQLTILSSEMGVLRQKLTERDEERGQLERKVTELSATVSSTLASYTFLEQALAAETTKLQQSWKDIHQAKDRGNELEKSLEQSEQHVSELSKALAQSEEQLCQLQTVSESQKTQIQQLQDLCTQLSGVREMNEFLQMENELAREQVAESERTLRANLQGLRERNIQCEDLKGELNQLQHVNRSLQEQLETTRSAASAKELELGEKLAQAVTEITLLHHTMRGLTNELHEALNDKKDDKESQAVQHLERRHPSSSFVDSIMVALTAEKEEDDKSDTPPVPDMAEPQSENLFSEKSAFIRVAAVTPKKNLTAEEFEQEEDDQCCVAELLVDLGSTVTELVSTLKLVLQRKDSQLERLHNTIFGLQEAQQTANSKHEAEVSELKLQLSRVDILAERGNQALQQKALDEKTVATLSSEIQEVQEILNKHKSDNNELRKEVVELRRSLQQSKVESQFLREEVKKSGAVSANTAHVMEEKIRLLREVERLKRSLQEVEQARVKILERAKRHQMIHQSNQQKSENELQMLNNMINKVRETLLSLPEVLKNCKQLQQLAEYIG